MSIAKDQRDALVRYEHPLMPSLKVVSARTKYDRRRRVLVAEDHSQGNGQYQILREWWPITSEAQREAEVWLDGYRFAKVVFA